MVPANKKLARSDKQVSCELDGEAVLLNIETGRYFALNAVATDIWSKLEQPIDLVALIDALSADYDAKPVDIAKDVTAFASKLVDMCLLTICEDETNPS